MEYRRLYPDRQDIDAKSYSVKKSMWAILSTERQEVLSNEKSNENKTYIERTMKLISYIPYISEYVCLWITSLYNLYLTDDEWIKMTRNST